MSNYQPVIGLEIHVELKTKSKMFCQCSADYFGKEPNTNTCPVCLGMPGALPVPNKTALEWTVRIGRAFHCKINLHTKFDRKHYFYPDLAKGYQISQFDQPVATDGYLDLILPPLKNDSSGKPRTKRFRIHRIHLEEDTGKLTHVGQDTLVDFNRSSVPLVEIVTEPDFDNSDDVKAFLEELHAIIRTLDVSDADMEKGSMRMEPNISLREVKSEEVKGKNAEFELPDYKVEVKNINSFNFAKKAIDFELKRQQEILEKGEKPPQETRGYDEKKGETYSQRSKENAHDYRYFPEPDIPPIEFTKEQIERISSGIPPLPADTLTLLLGEGLKYQDAFILSHDMKLYEYFLSLKKQISLSIKPQQVANFIINKRSLLTFNEPEDIKQIEMMSMPKQIDEGRLTQVVTDVVTHNEKLVSDYKSGKVNALNPLIGFVMKEMKGQADATTVRTKLEEKLAK